MLRRHTILTSLRTSSTIFTVVVVATSTRNVATRSGPRAFKTDRERRRALRDQTILDSLPLTEYELQRRNRILAPSSSIDSISVDGLLDAIIGIDGGEEGLSQTTKERAPRPGRNYQVEQSLSTMRESLSAGPKSQSSGALIAAAIDKKRKSSLSKQRQPLSRLISQKQQQQQQSFETTTLNDEGLKAKENENDNNQEQQVHESEKPVWDPVKSRRAATSATASTTEIIVTLQTEESAFISLENHNYSSLVQSDVGAEKLDEIELARSSDLVKRMQEMKPLPVFADDEQAIQKYLSEGSNDDQQNELTMRDAINRARSTRLEELSKEFYEKYDGEGQFTEEQRFKKVAEEAKEKLKDTPVGEFIATAHKGDELTELKELAKEVDRIHRHNALVKKTNKKIQQILEKNKEAAENNHFNGETPLEEIRPEQQLQEDSAAVSANADNKAFTRPKAEKIDPTARDFLEDRSHLAKRQTRVRFPSSEFIAKQHSPAYRGESELATMAQLLPVKRFTHDELVENNTPVVHTRGELAEVVQELHDDEKQTMSPLDARVDSSFENDIRRGLLMFYHKHPINQMIKTPYVIIGGIQDDKGHMHRFDDSERPQVSLHKGRAMAAEHGKDLMQVMMFEEAKHEMLPGGGRGGVALCYICDHFGYAMDDIRWRMHTFSNVTADPLKPLLEVGFRGVTHDFAIRFKSIYVAKFLFKKFPVRVSLTKFGGPREGFPIMERVLSFIKTECEKMKAHFVAGQIRYDQASIWVYLHPSTPKLPLNSIEAPSGEQLRETLERAIFDAEYDREVTIPMSFTGRQQQAANRYSRELDEGTAWAWRSEGISLSEQRKMKIHQGMLPKGNKKLYAARGDVDMKDPFKSHSTGKLDSMSFPRESNLEQAERGAGVLARRAMMTVSETHDKNELPSQTHVLGDWDFMLVGDVFEAGAIKEALNIKRNRKKVPKFAPGFATIGVKDDDGVDGKDIMKF